MERVFVLCTFFRTEIFVEIRVDILTTERVATQAGVLTSARNMKRSHALVSIPRLLGLFLVWTLLVHQLAFATSENEENPENVIIENEQMSMWQRVFGGGDDTVKKLEARMLRVEELLRHDNERLNAEIQELRVEIGSHSDIQGMLVRDVLQAVKFLREIREEEASRREDVSEGETLEKRFAVFQGVVLCVYGCLEGVCQRVMQMLRDTAVELLQSWDNSSLGVRIVLFYLSFHAATTLWTTLKNSLWLMSLGGRASIWCACKLTTYASAKMWSKSKPKVVADEIEAFRHLQDVKRQTDEPLLPFLARLQSAWHCTQPRVSEARVMQLIKLHLPKEFMMTLHDVNVDEASIGDILKRLRNFIGWTKKAPSQTQCLAPERRSPQPQQNRQASNWGRSVSPRRKNAPPSPRTPPSPCRLCGGNHWNTNCPQYVCPRCNRVGPRSLDCAQGRCVAATNEIQDDSLSDTRSVVSHVSRASNLSQNPFLQLSAGCSSVLERETGSPRHSSTTDTIEQRPLFEVAGYLNEENQKRKVLIDSGSNINILPKKVAESYGIAISPSDTKSVSGFNGKSTAVLGRVVVQTRIGSEQEPVTYLVMDEASKIILGSPALEQFQFRLNCGERYLETRTGDKVLCNLIRPSKN